MSPQMISSTTTASAFSPWILHPQATYSAPSNSPIRRHLQRAMSNDESSRLPPLFDRAAALSPFSINARRNSFPDTRFLPPTSGSRSSKDPNDVLYMDEPLIALRPIIKDHHRLSMDYHYHHQQQQLPPIQDITFDEPYKTHPSTPLSCTSPSSRSNSLSSWSPRSFDCSSRKGSITSMLNLDSEHCLPFATDSRQDAPMASAAAMTTSIRRGRPRATKRKRNDDTNDVDVDEEEEEQKRRGMTKGLRHFSKLVSDKVAERGVTTYNQVADELAEEIRLSNKMTSSTTKQSGFEQKNIRRRVYDALNVLMAMDIIAKDKKEIRWLGIPSCFHNNNDCCDRSDQERKQRHQQLQIEEKIRQEEERHRQLAEQVQQAHLAITDRLNEYLQLRDLVSRNEMRLATHEKLIKLPFSVVRCDQDDDIDVAPGGRKAVIVSSTTNDDNESASVHSDFDILRTLGYGAHQNSNLPDPSWYPFLCPPHTHTVHAAS